MSDMRLGCLLLGDDTPHNDSTLSFRVTHCPPPPVTRAFSNPSWKVIVSASRGQYLSRALRARLFFFSRVQNDALLIQPECLR